MGQCKLVQGGKSRQGHTNERVVLRLQVCFALAMYMSCCLCQFRTNSGGIWAYINGII